MGTFTHGITLTSDSDRTETVEALVDTGATFTSIPAALLERLGVTPHRTVRLRLANGQVEEQRIGRLLAQLDGMQESIICVFGAPGSPPVIGAHTLEAFLLGVDPVEQRLVPVEGWWACKAVDAVPL
jgi:predicted aspartyl protease